MAEGERTPLEQALEAVLLKYAAYGGAQHDALVAELAEVARSESWWDDERLLPYLDLSGASARAWCSRRGIRRLTMVDADAVKEARATQRGQGWRRGVRGKHG